MKDNQTYNFDTYNFDSIIERRGSGSLKFDAARERGMPEGILPLWVADMDFRSPPAVVSALQSRVAHGIFGYSQPDDAYYNAVLGWFGENYGFSASRRDIIIMPGVVFALAQLVKSLTEPGDGIIIQPPVYYPFFEVVKNNGRVLLRNPLIDSGGRYTMDFEGLQKLAAKPEAKLMILCSPHNPVGRVWHRDELSKLLAICEDNGVTVISDEIHCDLTLPGFTHTNAGTLSDNVIICTSPSKTFNLAGLQCANIFVRDPDKRRRINKSLDVAGYSQLNPMGLTAAEAAYTHGKPWLRELREYIAGNYNAFKSAVEAGIPNAEVRSLEGTYLAWADMRKLSYTQAELDKIIVSKAKLWLDSGTMFGEEGEGFQRINLASPRSVIVEAAGRLIQGLTWGLNK